ncbi:MAG: M56 family metallopeptidase [Terracidiphilus sp.]
MKSIEAWILSYLLNSLWQVPLLFAAGLAAARTLRKVSIEAEHQTWVGVLVLQSLLPALSTLPHTWLQSLIASYRVTEGSGTGGVTVTLGPATAFSSVALPPALLAAVALVYCSVCAYFMLRLGWRCLALYRIQHEAQEIALDESTARFAAQCTDRWHIGRVVIASSSRIRVPITMRLFRNVVLLPEEMPSRVSVVDLQTVITHEMAHIRRNDFLKNLACEALALPLAWHPFLSCTRQRLMETREIACDAMASAMQGRTQYLQSLLRLAALLVHERPARIPDAIGIFDTNTLERRLMHLTNDPNQIAGARRIAAFAAAAAFALATCGSAYALAMHVDAAQGGSAGVGASTASSTVKVPAKEMEANVISKQAPKYPADAKRARIQGKVVLSAVISEKGDVEQLKVVSGPKELCQSALDAVQQWKYKPYLINGKPVAVQTTINVTYRLAK